MPVLVTGAAGFIGSHLCEKLIRKGETVVGIDNFDPYYNPANKRDNIKELQSKNQFLFFKKDIRDRDALSEIFQVNEISEIIHLAAQVGVRASIKNPMLYWDVNCKGTLNLLELSHKSVYGILPHLQVHHLKDFESCISPNCVTPAPVPKMSPTTFEIVGTFEVLHDPHP